MHKYSLLLVIYVLPYNLWIQTETSERVYLSHLVFKLPDIFVNSAGSTFDKIKEKQLTTNSTLMSPIYRASNIQYVVDDSIAVYNSQIDDFLHDGSLFDFIISFCINNGSSCMETPEF